MTNKKQQTVKDILKNNLTAALQKAGYKEVEPEVLPTTDPKFGDYYSPIALKLAKAEGKQPAAKVATFLVAKLAGNEEIFKVASTANGFINFSISPSFLQEQIRKIIEENEKFGEV